MTISRESLTQAQRTAGRIKHPYVERAPCAEFTECYGCGWSFPSDHPIHSKPWGAPVTEDEIAAWLAKKGEGPLPEDKRRKAHAEGRYGPDAVEGAYDPNTVSAADQADIDAINRGKFDLEFAMKALDFQGAESDHAVMARMLERERAQPSLKQVGASYLSQATAAAEIARKDPTMQLPDPLYIRVGERDGKFLAQLELNAEGGTYGVGDTYEAAVAAALKVARDRTEPAVTETYENSTTATVARTVAVTAAGIEDMIRDNFDRQISILYKGVGDDCALWRRITPRSIERAAGFEKIVPSYCHVAEAPRTFRLDRIQRVEVRD